MRNGKNMTETEAHTFVARWRRILKPWFARTEADALRNMYRSFIGTMGGGALIFLIEVGRLRDSKSAQVLALLGVFQFGLSLCMVLRLREARRALGQS